MVLHSSLAMLFPVFKSLFRPISNSAGLMHNIYGTVSQIVWTVFSKACSDCDTFMALLNHHCLMAQLKAAESLHDLHLAVHLARPSQELKRDSRRQLVLWLFWLCM